MANRHAKDKILTFLKKSGKFYRMRDLSMILKKNYNTLRGHLRDMRKNDEVVRLRGCLWGFHDSNDPIAVIAGNKQSRLVMK